MTITITYNSKLTRNFFKLKVKTWISWCHRTEKRREKLGSWKTETVKISSWISGGRLAELILLKTEKGHGTSIKNALSHSSLAMTWPIIRGFQLPRDQWGKDVRPVRSLCAQAKASQKTFAQLCTLMFEHWCPKPPVFTERVRYFKRQ